MLLSDRLHYLLRIVWGIALLIVIIGSLLPDYSPFIRELSKLHVSDKVEHFAAYAVLAFLPTLHERRKTLFTVACAVVAVGVLLEFGQTYSVGRFFDRADMAANTVGVCFGVVLGLPLRRAAD